MSLPKMLYLLLKLNPSKSAILLMILHLNHLKMILNIRH